MSTIEVRIRDEDDQRPVHLCLWPTDALDNLIPTLATWGVLTDAQPDGAYGLTGQFVVEGAASTAYFEVVAHSAEDST